VFFFLGESFAKFRPEKYDSNLYKGFSMEKIAKFRPEKYDFNLYKGFSMEKMAKNRQISKKNSFQIARLL